jgi:hypothetical protein
MKKDILVVPDDTIVVGLAGPSAAGEVALEQAPLPGPAFFHAMARRLVLSAHCGEGAEAYARGCGGCPRHGRCEGEAVAGDRTTPPDRTGIRVGPALLARDVGGRLEPLYPVPDDLVVEERQRDAIFCQPAYLEPLRGDFVQHDLRGLRLLVSSTRRGRVERLGGYLTRKGVRVWAERKAERLSEGEHYVSLRKLFELEPRPLATASRAAAARDGVQMHLRLRAGVGFVVAVETPNGGTALPVAASVGFGPGSRTARLEEVQVPLPDAKPKPGRRWRLCMLAPTLAGPGGMPPWLDDATHATLEPLPAGGKLFALASRRGAATAGAWPPGAHARAVIPAGSTFFVEYSDPVRVEQSTSALAGGY